MSLSLAENVVVAGADNRPPMLDKTQYSLWVSRMLLYIKGKENGKLLSDSVLNRPFKYETVTEPRTLTTPVTIRDRRYDEFTDAEKIREACDIKETNIVLRGLSQDIYNLVNHHVEAYYIWDKVKLLIEGSEILLQERESKLYDEFDMFTSEPGETIHLYDLSFAQLINDMHSIRMTMKPIQVNTNFISHLQPEWSKFVTDVKLAKDLHGTNFDHLYDYLRQHKAHANKATIQDGRVTVQGKQTQGYAGVMLHAQGLIVMGIEYSRNSTWFKEKAMLDEALKLEEIPTLAACQTDNLDAFDTDYDETPSASAVLMAKLSSYDLEVLSEVPTHDTYLDNHVINQSVQEMQYSEQPPFIDDSDIDITKSTPTSEVLQSSLSVLARIDIRASFITTKESTSSPFLLYCVRQLIGHQARVKTWLGFWLSALKEGRVKRGLQVIKLRAFFRVLMKVFGLFLWLFLSHLLQVL
uniref:Integrase, catalytic region, zinc finger, CCHC-type, peptidase aspartic, catalytic n=1 Tax=Tanacetum cinerariifolium TaxID=118510 RepID=A0A6L2J8B5_TANCI|nr:hypothetical protein [Tanacetum cinerariifolium]